jgi:hypothetical protein
MKGERMRDQNGSGLGWPWGIVLALISVSLYAIAVALVIRSQVFDFSRASLSVGDTHALWAFLASGVTASLTFAGLLFTRSHSQRTLALQRESEKNRATAEAEAERRLRLETVVKSLDLIGPAGPYANSAKITGALAALVHLGHPIVAMRTLGAAWADKAVDAASAVWLINEILEGEDIQGHLEAATLLDIHAPELCAQTPGMFSWPLSIEFKWPTSMRLNTRIHLLNAVLVTLTSKSIRWWSDGGRAGWALSLLDEAVQHDPDDGMRAEAATAARRIISVVNLRTTQHENTWKDVTDIHDRAASVEQLPTIISKLRLAQQKLAEWVEISSPDRHSPE